MNPRPEVRTTQDALELRIIVAEGDRVPDGNEEHEGIAWKAVLEILKENGIWGATVIRGIAGFGTHGRTHRASLLAADEGGLPVLIVAVDRSHVIERVIPIVAAAAPDATITTNSVTVHRDIPV